MFVNTASFLVGCYIAGIVHNKHTNWFAALLCAGQMEIVRRTVTTYPTRIHGVISQFISADLVKLENVASIIGSTMYFLEMWALSKLIPQSTLLQHITMRTDESLYGTGVMLLANVLLNTYRMYYPRQRVDASS